MNGTLQELLIQYQQWALQFAQMVSPEMGEQVGQMILGQHGQQMPMQLGMQADTEVQKTEEHPFVERARKDARASTQAD